MDSTGQLHLAYETFGGLSYVKFDGTDWSAPVTVSDAIGGDIDLALDSNNHPHLVWWYYTDDTMRVFYSHFDGASWTSPEEVSTLPSSLAPSIVIDSTDRPHIIWETNSWPRKLSYRSKESSGWSSPIQLHLDSQIISNDNSDFTYAQTTNHLHVVMVSGAEIHHNGTDLSATPDTVSPTVQILSPTDGQALAGGSIQKITWKAKDDTAVIGISIEYTRDGGATFSKVATNIANDGAYQWIVPDISSETVQLRITAADAAGNKGTGFSGIFSVLGSGMPSGAGGIGGITPVAFDGTLSAKEDTVRYGVLNATGKTLTYRIVSQGKHGTVQLTDSSSGAFIYTPNSDSSGSDAFSFLVSDGQTDSNVAVVAVTIAPVNDEPVLTTMSDQTIQANGSADAIAFSVGDLETATGDLVLTVSSSDPELVPEERIVLGGTSADRTLTITPASGRHGSATITVTASDGTVSTSRSFELTVSPPDETTLFALERPGNAGADLTKPQTINSGEALTFRPTGGSGSFLVMISGPEAVSGSPYLDSDADGIYTFAAPTTGAFAGIYTISVTDTVSDQVKEITVQVPFQIEVDRTNIWENDSTRTIRVTGGAANETFELSVASVSGTDAIENIDTLIPVSIQAANEAEKGNPAIAAITPGDVAKTTSIRLQATSEQPALPSDLKTVSTVLNILPVSTYTIIVADSTSGLPIEDATITLRKPSSVIEDLESSPAGSATRITDSTGTATYQLAAGNYAFRVEGPASKDGIDGQPQYMEKTIDILDGMLFASVSLDVIIGRNTNANNGDDTATDSLDSLLPDSPELESFTVGSSDDNTNPADSTTTPFSPDPSDDSGFELTLDNKLTVPQPGESGPTAGPENTTTPVSPDQPETPEAEPTNSQASENDTTTDTERTESIITSFALEQPGNPGTDLTKPQIINSGAALNFRPTGGSGSFLVMLSGPEIAVGSPYLDSDADGIYTFAAPTTGAFAGIYTISVTDTVSDQVKEITVQVPFQIEVDRTNIWENDSTRTIRVTGGAVNETFELSIASTSGTDTVENTVTLVPAFILAANDVEKGNPAIATITPGDVAKTTSIRLRATSDQPGLPSGLQTISTVLNIAPVSIYSITVVDSTSGLPIENATVTLREPPSVVEGLESISAGSASHATGSTGVATFQLADGNYTFRVQGPSVIDETDGQPQYTGKTIEIESGVRSVSVSLDRLDGNGVAFSGTSSGNDTDSKDGGDATNEKKETLPPDSSESKNTGGDGVGDNPIPNDGKTILVSPDRPDKSETDPTGIQTSENDATTNTEDTTTPVPSNQPNKPDTEQANPQSGETDSTPEAEATTTFSLEQLGNAGTDLTKPQVINSGAALTFRPTGGSGSFLVMVSGPEAIGGSPYLDSDSNGIYTFAAPTTGAFAGVYTISVTDTVSDQVEVMTVHVPFRIEADRTNVWENDVSRTIRVTGGAVNGAFELSVTSASDTDTVDNAVSLVPASILAANEAEKGNPAIAAIAPGDVAETISIRLQATSDQPDLPSGLKTVSTVLSIVPVGNYTIMVSDATSGLPIENATVALRKPPSVTEDLETISAGSATRATDSTGKTAFQLAAGNYAFHVEGPVADGQPRYVGKTVEVIGDGSTISVSLDAVEDHMALFSGRVTTDAKLSLAKAKVILLAKTAAGKTEEIEAPVSETDGSFTVQLDLNGLTPTALLVTVPGGITVRRNIDNGDGEILEYGHTDLLFTVQTRPPVIGETVQEELAALFVGPNKTQDLFDGAVDPANGLKTISAPDVSTLPAAIQAMVDAVEVAPKPSGAGKSSSSGAFAAVDAAGPVIQVFKKDGKIVLAPVVHQELSTPASGPRTEVSAGTKPMAVGDDADTEFAIDELRTVKKVGIQLPGNAFKTGVAEVFATVRGVTIDPASASAKRANFTGGELVEIDLAIFDTSQNILSTDADAANPENDVIEAVEVTLPVSADALEQEGYDAAKTAAAFVSGELSVWTAPNIADFEAGRNLTPVTGTTYNPATGNVEFSINHFSVFGIGPGPAAPEPVVNNDPAPAVSDPIVNNDSVVAASGGGDGGQGGGGCFIATAAYGSYEQPYVQLLRRFRDRFLLTNAPGTWFVEQYYKTSPPLSDWLLERDGWRAVVRVALLPLIGVSWVLLEYPVAVQLLLLIGVMLITMRVWFRLPRIYLLIDGRKNGSWRPIYKR